MKNDKREPRLRIYGIVSAAYWHFGTRIVERCVKDGPLEFSDKKGGRGILINIILLSDFFSSKIKP